jgi:hypothetical protein
MDFFRTDKKAGKKYVFEVEPRDALLKANKHLSGEKQQRELKDKI